MPRFFQKVESDTPILTGEDALHVMRSLRMKAGEQLTLCDGEGYDYLCQITGFDKQNVYLSVLEKSPSVAEPSVSVHLLMGYPKADKLELIIQKAVELGVDEITPVITSRCIARPDPKDYAKKQARLQKIALEAAKQCGRGKIPQVHLPCALKTALPNAKTQGANILFYEGGGEPLGSLISQQESAACILIGAEGGFAPEEVQLALENGFFPATLGKRILRCETAPICALSLLMYITQNLQ